MKNFFNSTVKNINNMDPARIMVIGFAAVILLGALLLNLPIASQNGHSVGFLNALFTSTSAVCVTGLVVVDTSGSISQNDLCDFFSEIHHVYKAGTVVEIIEIDTKIQRQYTYSGKWDLSASGRGIHITTATDGIHRC